jgi:signal transduction histidine kinase
MRWREPGRPAWGDAALAAAVLALGAVEVAVGQVGGPYWATVPSVLSFGLPLAWRRQYPWTSLLIVYGTILGLHLSGVGQDNYLASVAAALLVVATFAGAVELSQAIAGLVLCAAVLIVSALTGLASIIWGVGLVVGAWTAGRALRSRRLLIEELARTTEALRLSREAHVRDAVAAERARIARELHDVIAHSVGVMVVQAGAAERMIPLDPDRATAATQSVQQCGREALVDLRRLLGVLRPDDATAAGLSPAPGLGDVPALLDRLRAAGLAVSLDRTGTPSRLPPGADLAAFRIVQEALTNVLKHGRVRSAALTLRHADQGIDIEVVNAVESGTAAPEEPGHGLIGIRERSLLYGGSCDAGLRDNGEFAVHVHLPAAAP